MLLFHGSKGVGIVHALTRFINWIVILPPGIHTKNVGLYTHDGSTLACERRKNIYSWFISSAHFSKTPCTTAVHILDIMETAFPRVDIDLLQDHGRSKSPTAPSGHLCTGPKPIENSSDMSIAFVIRITGGFGQKWCMQGIPEATGKVLEIHILRCIFDHFSFKQNP